MQNVFGASIGELILFSRALGSEATPGGDTCKRQRSEGELAISVVTLSRKRPVQNVIGDSSAKAECFSCIVVLLVAERRI